MILMCMITLKLYENRPKRLLLKSKYCIAYLKDFKAKIWARDNEWYFSFLLYLKLAF